MRIGVVGCLIVAIAAGACEEQRPKPAAPPAPAPSHAPAPTAPAPAAPAPPAPVPPSATGSTGSSGSAGATATSGAPAPSKAAAPMEWETDSGVLVQELKIGDGPEAGKFSTVRVQYVGTLADGREFDNTYRRPNDPPFVVRLGEGMIIKGWKDGIPGMKVGGKRRLTVPPQLAYGKTGHPPMIGPDAMLVFEIELMEIVK